MTRSIRIVFALARFCDRFMSILMVAVLACRSWMNRIPKILDGDYSGSEEDSVNEAIKILVSGAS
jgi:hypothetical protein